MSEGGSSHPRVGVRELRQNLSVYLRRVERGETLDVTEHGRLVAQLGPAPVPTTSILERLIAEGRATPPSRRPDAIPEPVASRGSGEGVSEALRRIREDEAR
jgi:prevent-host-death family protein